MGGGPPPRRGWGGDQVRAFLAADEEDLLHPPFFVIATPGPGVVMIAARCSDVADLNTRASRAAPDYGLDIA